VIEALVHWGASLTDGPLMPHGVCLLVELWLIVLMLAFHIVIWLDYLAISNLIGRIVAKGDNDTLIKVATRSGFMWFIRLCGWTHFAAAVVLFIGGPAYWIMALALGLTAAISSRVALFLLFNRKALAASIGGADG